MYYRSTPLRSFVSCPHILKFITAEDKGTENIERLLKDSMALGKFPVQLQFPQIPSRTKVLAKRTNAANYQLSIVGVKNLTDKNLGIVRKLLWIIALTSCCCMVVYYVASRVIYILSFPTQVGVTLRQNESLELPHVTLCPNTPFHPAKLEALGLTKDGLPGPNFVYNSGTFNVSNLWRDIAINASFIVETVVSHKDSALNWKETFTSAGLCYLHTYGEQIQASGLNFGMSIQIDWDEVFFSRALTDREGMKLYFHTSNDEPLTEIEGINVAPREDVSIAIRMKEFNSLNRKEHPCASIPTYSRSKCVNRCFHERVLELTKCNLPFMVPDSSEVWCDTKQTYGDAFRTFWKKAKSNLTLWADCGAECIIECKKRMYTPYIESVSVTENNQGKFVIYFPEMWYEIVEEKEAYDIIALLCDIGGTFGLFLGCSLLTLVEVIESIGYYFYTRT